MKTILSPSSIGIRFLAGIAASAAVLGCTGTRDGAMPYIGPAKAQTPVALAVQDKQSAIEKGMFSPTVGQDALGNRIAVWEEFDGVRFNIWAKRSVAGLGWGVSQRLDAQHDGNAYSPCIAFDVQGNAMAVWEQRQGGQYKVWANRYEAGKGWGAAQAIDTAPGMAPGNANAPQVALNALGEAMAVWQQSDGHHSHIRSSRFLPGVGWGTTTSMGSAATHASAPQIAFDARGNALAVWQQFDGLQTQVWASQQSEAGGNWAHAAQLGVRAGPGDSLNPTLAVDAVGKATALWQQVDGANSAVWARDYSASLGWGRPSLIEPHFAAQDVDSAPLAAHATGESVVAARWPMLRNKTQPTR
jgi:hypothetical protein